MVPDYSLDNASKQNPYFDWISQDEETGRNGSSDQKMIERVIWCQVLAKKRMNVEKRNDDGCFETPTMNGKQGLNEICPWRQNLGEFWRIGPASVTTWPSDHHHHHQIICCRIQQIFLHFCKIAFDGVVNSLSLAQSVDWSILFVQLYEQTIQGVYNALSLSSVDALSPDPRVDVLQCLQKRHSPCHEMDWVGFYWASYLLSSSW